MKSIFITLLSLLLSSLIIHLDGGAVSIEDTCKFASTASIEDTCKAASTANPSIKYDFCVSTFLGSPKRRFANDTRGLAKIAALIAMDYSVNIKRNISDLRKNSPDPATKSALKQCFDFYDSIGSTFARAVDNILTGKDEVAKGYLKTGIQGAEDCEAALEKAGIKAAPLAEGNSEFVELSDMSIAILDLVAKKPAASDHDDMMT